jgi:hypothetical protein
MHEDTGSPLTVQEIRQSHLRMKRRSLHAGSAPPPARHCIQTRQLFRNSKKVPKKLISKRTLCAQRTAHTHTPHPSRGVEVALLDTWLFWCRVLVLVFACTCTQTELTLRYSPETTNTFPAYPAHNERESSPTTAECRKRSGTLPCAAP